MSSFFTFPHFLFIADNSSKQKEGSEQQEINVEALLRSKAPPEERIDEGGGQVKIWRIHEFEKVEYPVEMYGHFFSADSFIILYTYQINGVDKHIIYFWQGRDSSSVTLQTHFVSFLISLQMCVAALARKRNFSIFDSTAG